MGIFDHSCLQLLQTFARVESGTTKSQATLEADRQEWLREHMLALLQLLLHLARKDVVDFSNEERDGADVADVVLYGMSIIQPLVTPESLQ